MSAQAELVAELFAAVPETAWPLLLRLFEGVDMPNSRFARRDRLICEYGLVQICADLGERAAARDIARLMNRIACGARHDMPEALITAVRLNGGEALSSERIRQILRAGSV